MTTDNMSAILSLLSLVGGVLVLVLLFLVFAYYKTKNDEKNPPKSDIPMKKDAKKDTPKVGTVGKTKQYTICSVFDFMNFEKIEDNMIVQRKGKRYLMVIDCQGINYDLMSQEEKIGVEEGFIQFLNALRDPVQIFVQTRKVNLEESLREYNKKVDEVESAYRKQNAKYIQLSHTSSTNNEVLKKEYLELIKLKNLLEYGRDIVYNTERMSLNRNILTKKYYVVISYYPDDEENKLDKEEIKETAFSDLYTKAQSMISLLGVCGIIGKIMDSAQLADLLYSTFNREDSDVFGVDKAIRAKYDELYTTAPDYMNKKIEMLDQEIERKAYDKANASIVKAQSKLDEEYSKKIATMDEVVDSLAKMIIDQNTEDIGQTVSEMAKEEIDSEKRVKEGKK